MLRLYNPRPPKPLFDWPWIVGLLFVHGVALLALVWLALVNPKIPVWISEGAEAELAAREERVQQLHIRPLELAERERFTSAWQGVQARFVDEPREAVSQADELIAEVMAARGYPMGDFEQRAADISVDHPSVVEHYRAAHAVATRRDAGTEDLRQAMVHYRTLFEDMIEAGEPAHR